MTDWLPPGPQQNSAADITEGKLTFLNHSVKIGDPPRWRCDELPRLWQYNLHYFEYLWALPPAEGRRLALDWIAQHPPGRGQVGWEPYPTSLRIMNWCAVFFGRDRAATAADTAFTRKLWHSLHQQICWLESHLEYHLLGNHLLENAVALSFAGACFTGRDAERWMRCGGAMLRAHLVAQILDDGVHFELSPMYHVRIAYALALLANTGHAALRTIVEPHLRAMVDALPWMCHPDGEIALLNDTAIGIYNQPGDVIRFARRALGEEETPLVSNGHFSLSSAGYFGWRDDAGHYVICDAAPIGPDYIPGHAHADIFSFELSLAGRRIIVDAGNFDYEVSDMRRYCRSTAAHNTIEINGTDQCEMWGAFRVGRRGRPRAAHYDRQTDGFTLHGWHDAYLHQAAQAVHERRFRWFTEGVLLINDMIRAPQLVTGRNRVHLHPECRIAELKGNRAVLDTPVGTVHIMADDSVKFETETGWYCPQFGLRQPTMTLLITRQSAGIDTALCISYPTPIDSVHATDGAMIDGRRYV